MNKKELYRKLVEEITIIDVNRFSYSDSFRAGEAAGKIKGLESAKKLLNQLEEPELPVIPQFVADWIEINKNIEIDYAFELIKSRAKSGKLDEFDNWVNKNKKMFALAFVDSYTIEKEKLYKVLLPGVESLDRQMCMHEETKVVGFASDGYNSRKYSEDDKFIRLFTEQEIKAIDERYWAFREEVTND